jgi:hypothetical protein
MQCVHLGGQEAHRVGYAPDPWDWTPWRFAKEGRFDGRWDDPDAIWRALYVGSSPLACYLEVLAHFRPDPEIEREMADIVVDDDDEDEYPTVPPGELSYSWCDERRLCSAEMSGCYVLPGHHESLPTLRQQFVWLARSFGLADLDGAAIRDSGPRDLTQEISKWIYSLNEADGHQASGIQYQSRHGDELTLWAIYERGESYSTPPNVTNRNLVAPITPNDPALLQAMQIHRIRWPDT